MPYANLALKFFLELAALVGAGFGGWHAAGWWGLLLAPTLFALAWGLLAAPKARHQLPTWARIPFEVAALTLCFAALAWAGHGLAAAVLCVLTGVNLAGLTLWRQWEH